MDLADDQDEESDLQLVELFLSERGLKTDRFTKEEMKARKTPDFKTFLGDEWFGHCEVKSPQRDDWLDKLMDEAAPGEIVGGGRDDPTFNKLSGLIKKGAEQIHSVDPKKELVNVMVLVNHNTDIGFNDLFETLTGHFRASDGTVHLTMPHVSEGHMIGERKHWIDLYIWMDAAAAADRVRYFVGSNQDKWDQICRVFNIDSRRLK